VFCTLYSSIGLRGLFNNAQFDEQFNIFKGNIAETMMSNMGFNQPKEFQYEKEHIELLLSDLETDYYDRYNFNDLQQYLHYI